MARMGSAWPRELQCNLSVLSNDNNMVIALRFGETVGEGAHYPFQSSEIARFDQEFKIVCRLLTSIQTHDNYRRRHMEDLYDVQSDRKYRVSRISSKVGWGICS